jgi:hypothetical protein
MSVEERINILADQIAAEGMVLRAADVRAGAVEIARQGHEIEQLKKRLAIWERNGGDILQQSKIDQLRSLLFRARNYIAGEKTSDRPKDAMLEQIDAALEWKS